MAGLTLSIWLGVVGAVAGCFAGLVSLRLPVGDPVVRGRSACGGCSRPLRPHQLVPLLSYAASGGRCASCRSVIPVRYPLMETGCALIGIWAAATQSSFVAAVLTALLGWQLLLIAVVDGEHMWLPDSLTLPLGASGVLAAAVLPDMHVLDSLIGCALGLASLWGLAEIHRKVRGTDGLGGGDPFLLATCGAWVGWAALPIVVLVAATSGLALVSGRALAGGGFSRMDRIPFGPLLALGTWVAWNLR